MIEYIFMLADCESIYPHFQANDLPFEPLSETTSKSIHGIFKFYTMGPVNELVKLVGSGIGAARESYLENQEQKSKFVPSSGTSQYQASNPASSVHGREHSPEAEDEELEDTWLLDEASQSIDPPSYEEANPPPAAMEQDPKDLVGQVLQSAPPPSTRTSPIPLPVILPQRRPGTKGRGFVRAYAPVLSNAAIDQQTFLLFLKNLHLASSASTGLKVVFIAGAAAGVVPEPITQIVSAAVQVTAGAAIEAQRRYRANAFLDEMNERLFKPRGLFAMVVAYKPDARKAVEVGEFDPTDSVARYGEGSGQGQGWKAKLRSESGYNHGELSVGECAPLIYPALEDAREGATEEQRGRWKRFEKFMGEYGDRRAQATYVSRPNASRNEQSADSNKQHEHPNSALTGPETPRFRSRYADPNHPANSGSLISLVTGGVVNPQERRQNRRQERRERLSNRIGRPLPQRGQRSRESPIKRVLQENVMYLMIANMPSEQDLAAARSRLAAQENRR